jgi:hypothetical protein
MRSDLRSEPSATVCCPGCATLAVSDHCPGCGIWLAGPQAAELLWIAAELARLDDASRWLRARRAGLLAELACQRQPEADDAAAPPCWPSALAEALASVPAEALAPALAEALVPAPAGPNLVRRRRTEMSRPTAAGRLVAGATGRLVAGATGRLAAAVEVTAWLAAVAGIALSLGSPEHASIVIAVTGALCLGVALRPDRRPAIWVGLILGETALCIWLAATGMGAPEPYAVPASAVALGFGWQRSRHSPRLGSWLAYGPGLAVLLLPSLAAAWQDHLWIRPLLLGLVAVAVTLAGARARLQAPLLIGAGVAVLDAAHELAPEVSRLAGMLPRWAPVALAGAILLWTGATYEARLRGLSRLRTAVARLR